MIVSEQNIIDVEKAINNLIQQKEKLVFDKKENELKLAVLKSQVRSGGRMHNVKYQKICEEQNKLKKDHFRLERGISELAIEIMNKSTLKNQLAAQYKKQKTLNVKEELISIRDFYINFASDKTRVSSMRAMGAEFAEKLETLIKTL